MSILSGLAAFKEWSDFLSELSYHEHGKYSRSLDKKWRELHGSCKQITN